MPWFTDRLDQLRREQNPARYDTERPVLRVPEPPPPTTREEHGDETPHVIIIDMEN